MISTLAPKPTVATKDLAVLSMLELVEDLIEQPLPNSLHVFFFFVALASCRTELEGDLSTKHANSMTDY